jgi:hypothetical protein
VTVAPERRPRLVVIRGGVPSEADGHAPCPPPDGSTEVSLGRVLRIAGLIIVLSPVVLAGAYLVGWIAWQIAVFTYGLTVPA